MIRNISSSRTLFPGLKGVKRKNNYRQNKNNKTKFGENKIHKDKIRKNK